MSNGTETLFCKRTIELTCRRKGLLGYMARHHVDIEEFHGRVGINLQKLHDCQNEYMSSAEAGIFEYAFKLGLQIAVEVLSK